jgi:hypothetical protein
MPGGVAGARLTAAPYADQFDHGVKAFSELLGDHWSILADFGHVRADSMLLRS